MPGDSEHHSSRRRHYSVLLVANDDVAQPKTVRLTLWQLVGVLGGTVGLIVGIVFVLLFFTPLGAWINIPNPQLEIRYSQELVSLNQKMASLMEQLIEIRSYNVKLRNALGEVVVATDSGVVVTGSVRRGGSNAPAADARRAPQYPASVASSAFYPLPVESPGGQGAKVAFPAILPSEGYVTRGFSPVERHFGLDIAGKVGTPVNAAAEGYVVFAGWTTDEGYVVILSHANGFLSFYKHNQSLLKNASTFVKRGEPIALLGNSGKSSSGPHLHFEIWKDGTPVDPSSYLLNYNL
ncbi:MAG TPA: M23 family metallopeptidase [Bacteroidota bacterium]|nr:M23 family metallopeptidase [Bacteroidota bacterium]